MIKSLRKRGLEPGAVFDTSLAQDLARLVARDGQDWAIFFDRRGHQVAFLRGPVAFAHWEPPPVRKGLCGIRCLQAKQDSVVGRELVLAQSWRLDALAIVHVKNGKPGAVTVALPRLAGKDLDAYQVLGPLPPAEAARIDASSQIEEAERAEGVGGKTLRARALVVALRFPGEPGWQVTDMAEEMVLLARSAGAEVAPPLVIPLRAADPANLVGKGRAQQIEAARREAGANLVVFSQELTPAQARNLERAIGGRVLDRTQLILDIFAQRARTREGKLQVELAQLTYLLPRLTGSRPELDRLGGGIGTRGPGETRLEVDRRRVRERISQLQREIEEVRRTRTLQREERQSVPYPLVALVGYTNAGKSTLLNALTGAGVLAEDRLFATLDPTTRLTVLPSGQRVLLSDTVGFIRQLPPHLIAAFRATLEEVAQADVLLHVVDASSPAREEQMAAVDQILAELGADCRPRLTVLNKIDLLPEGEWVGGNAGPDAVPVSALTGQGIETLREKLDALFSPERRVLDLTLRFEQGWALSWAHAAGRVLSSEYGPEGTMKIRVELDRVRAARLLKMLGKDGGSRVGERAARA